MPTSQHSSSRAVANRFWPGRRVLVAGGTHGFGLVLARQLAGRGARLLVVGRSSASVRAAIAACESAATAAGWPGEGLHGLAADLAQPGEGDRVVAVCLEKLGGLDSLFFCIGRSGRTAVLKLPADELRAVIEVNLMTAIEISQAAAEPICRAGGELVYVGSLAGKLVTPAMGAYAVGKSALAAFADAVRLEVAPRGGHVLLVSPGPIRRHPETTTEAGGGFHRYDEEVAQHGLSAEVAGPGGGAAVKLLDPEQLAAEVLEACRLGRLELTRPWKASLLAGLIEWFPAWGRRLLARFTATSATRED
jgi:NAD(P)-dependent dehydrogenase (short-subunit alcohol dehydrogenase family)